MRTLLRPERTREREADSPDLTAGGRRRRTHSSRPFPSRPRSAAPSLSFYLKTLTDETTTGTAYDTLKVQAISGGVTTTLATYSNLNKSTGYVLKTLDLSSFKGKTVTLRFLGVEDSSLKTYFFVDDTSVTTS